MRSWHCLLLCGLLAGACVGCGHYDSPSAPVTAVELSGRGDEPAQGEGSERADNAALAVMRAPDEEKQLPRKVIYNADVRLVVPDLSKAEEDLKRLLKENDGLVALSEITGSSGAPRQGVWKVRVPVARFDSFVEAVVKLGVPLKNRTDSQDVTEEYYDLADRIKNKKLEQETLRGYLQEKKATTTLDDILKIEKELSRVRGEIDQHEGKLRRLENLSALTTVNVTLQEIKDYVPPQTPGFGASVGSTFSDSIGLLVRFGRGVILVVVAVAPWLVVLALIAVPSWLGLRRWRPRTPALTPAPASPPPAAT